MNAAILSYALVAHIKWTMLKSGCIVLYCILRHDACGNATCRYAVNGTNNSRNDDMGPTNAWNEARSRTLISKLLQRHSKAKSRSPVYVQRVVPRCNVTYMYIFENFASSTKASLLTSAKWNQVRNGQTTLYISVPGQNSRRSSRVDSVGLRLQPVMVADVRVESVWDSFRSRGISREWIMAEESLSGRAVKLSGEETGRGGGLLRARNQQRRG